MNWHREMSRDDLVRDTYAHFGLALYKAQVLESGIVNAMVVARMPDRDRITRREIDSFMDRQLENTSCLTTPTSSWACWSGPVVSDLALRTVQSRRRSKPQLTGSEDWMVNQRLQPTARVSSCERSK